MPVSVCESSINSAIRESITNSTNNYINSSGSKNNNDNDTAESIQNKLAASAKRVLLSKIEYEEVNNYGQSVLDTLKSKYIVLKPLNGSGKLINQQCNNNNDKDANQQNTTITATTTSGQQNGQQRFPNELPQPKRCLYPRENIQIGWRSSNRKWQVGAGMMNVGNTCYLNSTLQAVFHVPAMANWLMSDSAHREKCEDENGSQGGCIICAMAKTLTASQSNQSSAIRPYLVYTKLRLICKHLTMGRQEDAHEFLRYLVEAMEKSYLTRIRNYKELDQFSKETTPLNQILGGYLKSAVRCLACGHVSTTFQHFQDLLLDIRKANTVEEALDGYFARERLEDMGYKCEACKKKVSATKQFSLERAPISLCIQLKRFSMMGTKLNKHITIRPRLDLTKYSSSKKNNGETLTYKLVAMVTHLGASQHCGHYTAIGLTDAGGYYQFDDSCVRPISLQNVLNTNAYIIFYELDEQHQQTNNRQTSTQVSGDHEKYKENYNNKTNGHGNNNENLHNNQQQRVNLFSANNNIQNSKLISKLDVGGGDNSLSTTGNLNNNKNTNGNRLIGPQLPDEFKNLTTSNGCNNNNNKLTNTQSPNKYNNNNNNNNKTNGDSSLSKWMHSLKQQNTNSNKLVINFKNSTTNSTTMSTTLNGQLNNNKFQDTNGSTKLVNKIKTENNNNNDNNNDDYNKSTEIIKINNNKSTLPSMPKLLGSPKNEKSIINLNNDSTTINKNNNLGQLQNGLINSPIKSLVPYESDEDDDDNDNNNQKNYKTTEIQNGNNNNNNTAKRDISHDRMNNKINNKRKINNFNDDSSPDIKRSTPDSSPDIKRSSADSSPDIKRSKQTPPSPPVVKTKAGLWQVTPLEPIKPIINNGNTSSGSSSYTTTATTNSERKNPFATTSGVSGVSVTNATSSKFNGKKIDNYSKKIPEDRGPTVTELLKYSHRGYGAPVLNWNGQKTDMEKEISEETRMERKRELEDDEENEMDRGKQKKVKIQGLHGSNNNRTVDNPGFNPFQEQQLQNNNQNRRWNAGNNHHSNNNRFQHQNNNAYRHNNNNNNHYNRNHNHNNNFRRNKYQQQQQQRSHHHQRNGGWR